MTEWEIKLNQLHTFFNKQHFYKQRKTEIGKKNQAKAKQHPEMNFCYLTITCFLHPRYYPKIIGDTLKNLQKN